MSWFDTAWEHIAGEEEERELLMSAGVPALVVPLLADADTNVRLAALWTVINLTNGSALLPITIAVAALIVWAAQQCCLSIEGPRPIIKLDRLMRANAAHLHDCWLGDLVVVHGVSESIPKSIANAGRPPSSCIHLSGQFPGRCDKNEGARARAGRLCAEGLSGALPRLLEDASLDVRERAKTAQENMSKADGLQCMFE